MAKYKEIYWESLGYVSGDFVCCELTGGKAVDIHHIVSRGRGGSDRIENLMALTREEHIDKGDKQQYMKMLLLKHMQFLDFNGVKYDTNYFKDMILKYDN